MKTITKIALLTLIIVALFANTSNAFAYNLFWNHDSVTGSKVSHVEAVQIAHPHKHIHASTATTSEPELVAPPTMQDMTQCVVVNGEMLCVDVCGGRSVPYSTCSFE